MNRTTSCSKDSPNVSLSSSNGITRISNFGTSLMNENGHIVYRRSPVQQQLNSPQQPQSFDTLGSPSTTSYNSEEITSEANNSFDLVGDENINELSQKIDQLQRQIEALTKIQTTQDERYKRSRQENDTLLGKIHGLEDQLRELELSSETRAREDEKRFRDAMGKQMKLQTQECEQHLHTNFQLQQDLFKLKNDLLKSEALIKTLRSEKETLESELHEKNSELKTLDEEVHKLTSLVKNLKDEENVKSNLISILNEELEDSHNRSQQNNLDHSTATASHNNFSQSPKLRLTSSRRNSIASESGDDLSPTHALIVNSKALKDIDGLETSLEKIREENKKLREANEELQAQLLNVQLEEGMSLVQKGNKSYSLADEMGGIDVPRLVSALKEQQEDNARMRNYIDNIILDIMQNRPELLDKTYSSYMSNNNRAPEEPEATSS